MKFRVIAIALAGLCFVVGATLAQAPEKKAAEKKAPEKKMEKPQPAPEVKKLGYFVGTWTSEGEMKENPFGMPAGKFSGTDKCEWFTGGFHVVCHSTGKGPMGAMHGLGILAYNTEEKVYTYYGIDNMGFAEQSKGKVDGNNWVYTAEGKMGGKAYQGRYTMNSSSPDSYMFKYETSDDGQKWNLMMEGKATKAGAAEKKAAPAEKK
jgi:Protein of unknown function (DUF1579)